VKIASYLKIFKIFKRRKIQCLFLVGKELGAKIASYFKIFKRRKRSMLYISLLLTTILTIHLTKTFLPIMACRIRRDWQTTMAHPTWAWILRNY